MATPFSFRRNNNNNTPRPKEDDGWVHGGKYVKTPASTTTAATSSPYSMLSPLPLCTPLPASSPTTTTTADEATATPANLNGGLPARTPVTVQLERLTTTTTAVDTPASTSSFHGRNAIVGTTPSNGVSSTPPQNYGSIARNNNSQQQQQYTGQFIQTTDVATWYNNSPVPTVVAPITSLFSLILQSMSIHFPNASNILETILEYSLEITMFLWYYTVKSLRIIYPLIVWTVQTIMTLGITIGGTFILAVMMMVYGRESVVSDHHAAGGNGGIDPKSAVKLMREKVVNSPFFRRRGGKVNSSGGGNGNSCRSNGLFGNQIVNTGGAQGNGMTSPMVTVAHHTSRPSAPRSTPPASAMRRRRGTPHPAINNIHNNSNSGNNTVNANLGNINARSGTTPNSNNHNTTPKNGGNTRRVLFSETEHGEVSTEHFRYDKHLPASARKVTRNVNAVDGGIEGVDENGVYTPQRKNASATSSPAGSASSSSAATPESTILRPSRYFAGAAEKAKENAVPSPNQQQQPPAASSNVSAASVSIGAKQSRNVSEQQLQEEEARKQKYIAQYGLLPSITPLSKRYGRLKHQQQPLAFTNAPSTSKPANATTSTLAKFNVNAKRKRLELVGAASRLSRNRRARMGTTSTSLQSARLLGNGRIPLKRRRDQELDRTDEWVWRAMNSDGEKENVDAVVGGSAKRGKWSAGAKTESTTPVVGGRSVSCSSPKQSPSTLPAVMTPPKTPGRPSFSFGSATPAPKQLHAGATPGKPSLSSFSLDGTTPTPAKKPISIDTPAEDTKHSFSFQASLTAANGENKSDVPSFSFGGGEPKAESGLATDGNKSQPFAFGATAAATTKQKDSTSAIASSAAPSFSFGGTPAAMEPEESTLSTAPSFAFGSTSASTSAESNPSTAPSFAFGSTSSGPKPTESTVAPSFSFGGGNNASTPAPSGGFSFGTGAGNTTTATDGFAPNIQPAAGVQAIPSFGFGAGSAATSTASSSGASARRRAKGGRRK